MLQTLLVILTFSLALGYLLKKFVWDAIYVSPSKTNNKKGCHKGDCGC